MLAAVGRNAPQSVRNGLSSSFSVYVGHRSTSMCHKGYMLNGQMSCWIYPPCSLGTSLHWSPMAVLAGMDIKGASTFRFQI
jgi:hypothetical protein